MLDPKKIHSDLKDRLYELDELREELHDKVDPSKYAFWSILILGGSFIAVRLNIPDLQGKLISEENLVYFFIGYIVASIISLLVYLVTYHHYLSRFKKVFTDDIAPKIIHGLGSSFTYQYEAEISSDEINRSQLFAPFDRLYSQDLVTGTLGQNPIRFAELKLVNVKKSNEGNSKTAITLFDGIYLETVLTVSFPTRIWIVPRKHVATIAASDKHRLKLDHVGFKGYRVYVDDSEKGTQVLQSYILDRIDLLNKKLKKEVANERVGYHFSGNKLILSIPTRGKFLEPKLSRSIDSVQFIEEQTRLLNVISKVLEDLTLG